MLWGYKAFIILLHYYWVHIAQLFWKTGRICCCWISTHSATSYPLHGLYTQQNTSMSSRKGMCKNVLRNTVGGSKCPLHSKLIVEYPEQWRTIQQRASELHLQEQAMRRNPTHVLLSEKAKHQGFHWNVSQKQAVKTLWCWRSGRGRPGRPGCD